MPRNNHPPKVLIVEDERALADLYADVLAPHYSVRTAYTGEQAVDKLDCEPDVVLLDRRLPDMSGEDVVKAIEERKIDTRIALVTAVDPDFDIIEMGIDEYLGKPVGEEDLVDVVERLLDIEDIDAKRRALSAKQVKRNVLAVEKTSVELARNEEFAQLEADIDRLTTEIDRLESNLNSQHNPALIQA